MFHVFGVRTKQVSILVHVPSVCLKYAWCEAGTLLMANVCWNTSGFGCTESGTCRPWLLGCTMNMDLTPMSKHGSNCLGDV